MDAMLKDIEGGVTSAKGFLAAGAAVGIKYKDRDDMAIIYSGTPCVLAGVFTKNVVKAAPVIWDRNILHSGEKVRAVVVNSGIANACTGDEGMKICEESAIAAAKTLGIEEKQVLLGSTGVIGMQIPLDKITAGIETLSRDMGGDIAHGDRAARAIMTTDTLPKQAAVSFVLQGKQVTLGGMAKGSGMIHPNMCTMLAYVTTDAAISKEMLQKALSEDVQSTFNMISVDGDTSTNDTLLVLANGEAGNPVIDCEGPDYEIFCDALHRVNETLAKKMAGDGEGATALFEVKVKNADTLENARILAKSVICSSLTKAAVFGHDANWGRILCALGYSGVDFVPEEIELYLESSAGKILIFKDGKGQDYSEEEATSILSEPHVTALVDMHMGDESAAAWGCDLSYDYVKINADYRS